MSHGLTKKDSMFSVREVPWHGLGTILDKRPRTVTAALKAAGLDWKVDKVPVQLTGRYAGKRVDRFVATVRRDTGDTLGAVGPDYEVIQNHQAFELLAAIIGDGGRWETAGSLWSGQTVWGMVVLPDHIQIGGDTVAQYLLAEFAHDASRSLHVYNTPIRVVCNNTLTAARTGVDADHVYKVRHIGNTSVAIAQAREVMRMSIDYGKQFSKFGNRLARTKMTERQMRKALCELYPTDVATVPGLTDRGIKSRQQAREAIVHLFTEGATVGNAPGTKWCGVNAILEHYQHDQGGSRVSAQGRFLRATHDSDGFGRKALELVLAA